MRSKSGRAQTAVQDIVEDKVNCHNCSNATRYPDARVRCDLTGDLALVVCDQFKQSDGCKLFEPARISSQSAKDAIQWINRGKQGD